METSSFKYCKFKEQIENISTKVLLRRNFQLFCRLLGFSEKFALSSVKFYLKQLLENFRLPHVIPRIMYKQISGTSRGKNLQNDTTVLV